MFSSLINAVKQELGLSNKKRSESHLTGKITYNNAGWEKNKKDQANIQKDLEDDKTIIVKNPQSTRYMFDSKGIADLAYNNEDNYKEVPVASTAVKTIGYNPKTEDLNIQYTSGNKKYTYPGVPKEVAAEFMESPSKGKYLYYYIRPNYSTNV